MISRGAFKSVLKDDELESSEAANCLDQDETSILIQMRQTS